MAYTLHRCPQVLCELMRDRDKELRGVACTALSGLVAGAPMLAGTCYVAYCMLHVARCMLASDACRHTHTRRPNAHWHLRCTRSLKCARSDLLLQIHSSLPHSAYSKPNAHNGSGNSFSLFLVIRVNYFPTFMRKYTPHVHTHTYTTPHPSARRQLRA